VRCKKEVGKRRWAAEKIRGGGAEGLELGDRGDSKRREGRAVQSSNWGD